MFTRFDCECFNLPIGNSYTYAYDNNGNRTQYSHNGSYSAIFGFNNANQLTTAGGAADGSYDTNGNQTSLGSGLSFGYNEKNQTTNLTPSGGSTLATSYLDADQNGRTSEGTLTEQNGDLGLYSDTQGSNTSYFTHLPSGTNQILGETINGSNYYYLADLRGSVVRVTDASGNVQNSYSYDPYGNLLTSSGTVLNPYRFDGGYYDTQTSLYKLGERYYNAVDARWTQLDPSGQNPAYIFAGDDPVNLEDLNGEVDNTTYPLIGLGVGCGIGGAVGLFTAGPPGAVLGCAGFGSLGAVGGEYAETLDETYDSIKSFF